MDEQPYRPASETSLAWISIAFAILYFGLLAIDFVHGSQAVTAYFWAILLNAVLLFVGYLSLRSRPQSCGQQLAGAWFFVPIAGIAGDADNAIFATLSLQATLFVGFIVFMLIWAITLAIKQSRKERTELR
jgi:pheromone shutdown protein TraB